MIKIFRITMVALFASLALASIAHAQTGQMTLTPGKRAQYRFDYRGDGSPIKIGFNSPAAFNMSLTSKIRMEIFTPEQIAMMQRGEQPQPIGRGSPTLQYALFWQGAFRGAGTYHVNLDYDGDVPVPYKLEITGDGVSGFVLIAPTSTESSSSTVIAAGQKILTVNVSSSTDKAELRLPVPPEPAQCTRPPQVPSIIRASIKLCPNETYSPMRITGNNIAIFGDAARSPIVTGFTRQFAIVAEGSNIWIEGITIQAKADPRDLGAWLCLYNDCIFPTNPPTKVQGALIYGGGILLNGASNSTVHNVSVRGGAIGVATFDGRNNHIISNQLSDLVAWGSYNYASVGSYFVGNDFSRNNHGCTTPDGKKFLLGCETAGWVCLNCLGNAITRNRCELSGNCYYINGDRGLPSNDNKFIANTCAGASDNCFEITFSTGNLLQDNVAQLEPKSSRPCKYPFWLGGSVVMAQNNSWQCSISADKAFNESRDSTVVATNIINLDAFGAVQFSPLASGTRVPTRTPTATATPGPSATPRPTMIPVNLPRRFEKMDAE